MIRNHIKLNIFLQLTQIVLFIVAAVVFDWTHVSFEDEKYGLRTYHVSLVMIKEEDEIQQ